MKEFACRWFSGDKPCRHAGGKDCLRAGQETCRHYEPLEPKILIVKLGAIGDVLRTTTLLSALRKKWENPAITWITHPGTVPLLAENGLWKVLPWSLEAVLWAETVDWDCVISLDKEDGPTALAQRVKSSRKYGFGRNGHGLLQPLSPSGEYLFHLGIDDEEKFFRNTRSYPNLIAEACELEWGPNPYLLPLTEAEKQWAAEIAADWGSGPAIGIHVGSGDGFAGKKWPAERLATLAEELRAESLVPVFLAGAREKAEYQALKNQAWETGLFPGCEFSLRQFAALVSRLKVMVSGDTLAMHMAISQGVYAVAWFGSTVAGEIEFYGHGEALVGKVPCAPCFRKVCPTNEECLQQISVKQVLDAVFRGVNPP